MARKQVDRRNETGVQLCSDDYRLRPRRWMDYVPLGPRLRLDFVEFFAGQPILAGGECVPGR